MKKLSVLLLALCLCLCLAQGAAFAALPEGVTAIDLVDCLGEEALEVENGWLLDAETCVLLRNKGEWAEGDYETLVLELESGEVLSRTPVPEADFLRRQSFEDGVFTLWFTTWGMRESEENPAPYYLGPDEYVRAAVSAEGAVEVVSFIQDWTTVMPGGETAVRTGEDGSLYAVDLATGEEELLVQGFPATDMWGEDAEVLASKYAPVPDELPGAPEGREFNYYPFDPRGDSWSVREFYVITSLDAHRFVYKVSGWEWGAGFGIYDLETRTDHRVTGRGYFLGMAGDTLYGEVLQADVNTYASSPLPETVRDAFSKVAAAWWGNDISDYAFSPDGGWMAHLWREDPYDGDGPNGMTLIDLRSGDILQTYAIENPFAVGKTVSIAPEGRVMLFCGAAAEDGAATLYLMEGVN